MVFRWAAGTPGLLGPQPPQPSLLSDNIKFISGTSNDAALFQLSAQMLLLIVMVLTFLHLISSDSSVVHRLTWTESVAKRCHPDCSWTFFFLETNQPGNDCSPFFPAVSRHVCLHWHHVWLWEIMWEVHSQDSQTVESVLWSSLFVQHQSLSRLNPKLHSHSSSWPFATAFKVNLNENRRSRCSHRCPELGEWEVI